ncbi:MAG: hypothetical protein JW950_06875 [Deltaproteobacteria bacterium]|nr:hypothetical protein [Deltaproteobacteria bacterium]
MKEHAEKLVDLTKNHAEEIARQWVKSVQTNPKTPSYRYIPEERAIHQAIDFYQHFHEMFFAEQPYVSVCLFTIPFAEKMYQEGVPLSEAVYALILMRRQMWLFAEIQSLFLTTLERQQALESLNRTILIFDYAVFVMDEAYQNLNQQDIEKEFGAVKTIMMEGVDRRATVLRAAIMAVLLAACFGATYYSHAVLHTDTVFTHLFYIPIILASIWWQKRGFFVPLLLSILLIGSRLLFIPNFHYMDDVVRVTMFIVTGVVIALLTEGVQRAEMMIGRQRV